MPQNKFHSQKIGNWADTTAKHAFTMDPSGAPLAQILITEIQQQVVASAFGRSRGRRNDQWDYAGHTLLPRCTQGWPPGLLLGLYKAGMYQAPHGYSFTRAPVHDAHILLLQHLHHCCSILAHRMPYFSVLGILKYGIGWRPQIAPFENCSI